MMLARPSALASKALMRSSSVLLRHASTKKPAHTLVLVR